MKSNIPTNATDANHESAEAFIQQLEAEMDAAKNAPPLPEDTPDAFTQKHVMPLVVSVALAIEEIREVILSNITHQTQRADRDRLDLLNLAIALRKQAPKEERESLHDVIRDIGGRIEARLEELRETNTDGALAQTRGFLHAFGKLPPEQTAILQADLGMPPGETLKA